MFTAAVLIAKNFGNNSNIYQREWIHKLWLTDTENYHISIMQNTKVSCEWIGTVVIPFKSKSKYLKIIILRIGIRTFLRNNTIQIWDSVYFFEGGRTRRV